MKLKNVVDILKSKIVGKSRIETAENLGILFIFIFSILLTISIGLSAIYPSGIITVMAMLSSFLIFIFTIFLVIIWVVKEV